MNQRLLMSFLSAATLTMLSACSGGKRPATSDHERGRYLVEQVAMCADCHSPRDQQGRFVAAQHLHGSVLPFRPTVPMPWAEAAPRIAGLPGLDDQQAMHFLQTGELPGGRQPRPPMPEFRFGPADARAVMTYLRSLNGNAP